MKIKMLARVMLLLGVAFVAEVGVAQVSVDLSGYGVKVQTGKGVNVQAGNGVKVQTGKSSKDDDDSDVIGSDVEMEGVAVINGQVFIDGVKVPKGKTSYTSKKTGKSYQIHWGKNGNVEVSEK